MFVFHMFCSNFNRENPEQHYPGLANGLCSNLATSRPNFILRVLPTYIDVLLRAGTEQDKADVSREYGETLMALNIRRKRRRSHLSRSIQP